MHTKVLLTAVLALFCEPRSVNASEINNTHVDLPGLYFELLLTHLVELEARIHVTLLEMAQNQTKQLQQLQSSGTRCASSTPASDGKSGHDSMLSKEKLRVEVVQHIDHSVDGEWILFQHRYDGSVNFYRSWDEYRVGFEEARGEYWLGLDKLHRTLAETPHELLVVIENFQGGVAFAHYDAFSIGNESEKYAINTLGKYSGTAGDSLRYHLGSKFTTFDQQNDANRMNCAVQHHGAWWFKDCYSSHLNGRYALSTRNIEEGIIWVTFSGPFTSLKMTKMMVRPKRS